MSGTRKCEWAFVALGSNVGDRAAHLALARRLLSRLPDTTFYAESLIEETEPLGPRKQPRYLNQMVLLSTHLSAQELLQHCLAIEQRAGRQRAARWGPRTLDLDIVRYGDHLINEPDLVVPHRELANRDFWERELRELEAYVK